MVYQTLSDPSSDALTLSDARKGAPERGVGGAGARGRRRTKRPGCSRLRTTLAGLARCVRCRGAVALCIFIFILRCCGHEQRAAGPHHVAAAGDGGGGCRRPRIATPGGYELRENGGRRGRTRAPSPRCLFVRYYFFGASNADNLSGSHGHAIVVDDGAWWNLSPRIIAE